MSWRGGIFMDEVSSLVDWVVGHYNAVVYKYGLVVELGREEVVIREESRTGDVNYIQDSGISFAL